MKTKKLKSTNKKISKNSNGITLIALVVTIVLNCSYLAMVERKRLKKIKTSYIIDYVT